MFFVSILILISLEVLIFIIIPILLTVTQIKWGSYFCINNYWNIYILIIEYNKLTYKVRGSEFMKFVLAPDSFKESMSAKEVCISMENGIKNIFKEAEFIHVPMADGGEGTMQSLVDATGGNIYKVFVHSPMYKMIEACFGILGNTNTAVIEMAEASGIQLVKREKRNPLKASTYGTGELIKAALDKGVEEIIIEIYTS